MAETSAASKNLQQFQLSIHRESWAMPLLFLLLTIAVFAIYVLPSGEQQLVENAYTILGKETPEAFKALKEPKLADVEKALDGHGDDLFEKFRASPWDVGRKIGLPMAKVYLEKLARDFGLIARSSAINIAIFGLCALVPGVAGLIYRRRFWVWFLLSLAVLVGLNSAGALGSLKIEETMPRSGRILLFILSQVVLLILALRLRRHATGGGWLPLWAHNGLLALALAGVGVACFMGWGPGASGDAKPAPSWIWSFLGTGLTGFIYKWELILAGLPMLYLLFRDSPVWPARSGKNIVICLDGTTNTPEQLERGFAAQTNVFKLFRMLKSNMKGGYLPTSHFDASLFKKYGDQQIAFYYAGVGNRFDNDPIMQFLGGATGLGASEIIERAYLDLVQVFRPHDRVYIVGFSRGAATARLLARAIDARGAPQWIYTMKLLGKHRVLWRSKHKEPVTIDVLGCWDTVGSFGVAKTIGGFNFQQIDMGLDLTVPDNVRRAYHMVALDEQRDSFEPTLMEPDPLYPDRTVEVWFAGDHANIGGGWATDKLSDITLDFLLRRISSGYATEGEEAQKRKKARRDESWGVYLEAIKSDRKGAPTEAQEESDIAMVNPDPRGPVRHWSSPLYAYRPRKLPLHAVISDTVFDHMAQAGTVYAPEPLFNLQDAIDKRRTLIDKKVQELSDTQLITTRQHDDIVKGKQDLRLWRWSDYERERLNAVPPPKLPYVASAALDNAYLAVPAEATRGVGQTAGSAV